jgi:predicted Zn finger-like uncharacterized protein
MFTECPQCETTFRVTSADLRRAGGKVRCGECNSVFSALDSLADAESGHSQPEHRAEHENIALSKPESTASAHVEEDTSLSAEEKTGNDRDWLETGSLEFDIPPQKWSSFFGDESLHLASTNETTIKNEPDSPQTNQTLDEYDGDAASTTPSVVADEAPIETSTEEPETAIVEDEEPVNEVPLSTTTSAIDTTTQEEAEWMRTLYEAVGEDEPVLVVDPETSAEDTDSPDENGIDAVDPEDEIPQVENRSEPTLDADWHSDAESALEVETDSIDTLEELTDTDIAEAHQETNDEPAWDRPEEPQEETSPDSTDDKKYWHEVGIDSEDEHAPATDEAEQPAPPWAETAAEQTETVTVERRPIGWRIAAATLVVLLFGQLLHYQRDSLATHSRYGAATRGFYSLLNSPLYPTWDINSYEIRGSEAVTGETNSDILEIRAQVAVVGDDAVGAPLLQVLLRDRWANIIAGGVFSPAEYFAEPGDYAELLQPGTYVPLHISVNDPGAAAQGYELELCLQQRNLELQCSNRRGL